MPHKAAEMKKRIREVRPVALQLVRQLQKWMSKELTAGTVQYVEPQTEGVVDSFGRFPLGKFSLPSGDLHLVAFAATPPKVLLYVKDITRAVELCHSVTYGWMIDKLHVSASVGEELPLRPLTAESFGETMRTLMTSADPVV
jgi:hypothetical protein